MPRVLARSGAVVLLAAGWLAGAACLLRAAPADALAPCTDTCHLAQGSPVLLEDVRQIWVRRCTGDDPSRACLVSRRRLDGTLILERSAPSMFDHDFQRKEIDPHQVVSVDFQGAWDDLRQPFLVGPVLDQTATTVRLDGDALILTSTGSPDARRSLGCVPSEVKVHAAHGKTVGVVVATARCTSPRKGPHEIVHVFTAKPDQVR